MFYETREICSREGFKAYGYVDYFKIPSVVVVTTVADTTSKPKEKEKKQQKPQSSFKEMLLSEEQKQNTRHEISCHLTGYSKDAKAVQYEVKMHEYC